MCIATQDVPMSELYVCSVFSVFQKIDITHSFIHVEFYQCISKFSDDQLHDFVDGNSDEINTFGINNCQ